MDFVSAFLGVIAIIGIIVVGGFVIFFLGDLVLSILDPNYVRFGKGYKKDKDFDAFNEKDIILKEVEGPKQETKEIEFKTLEQKKVVNTEIKEPVSERIGDDFFDDIKDSKKEEELEEKKSANLDALRAEEEQFRANMLKAIEERRARRMENQEISKDIDFEKFFFDDDDIDVFGREEEKTEDIVSDDNLVNNLYEESKAEEVELEKPQEIQSLEEEPKELEIIEEKENSETLLIDNKELEELKEKYLQLENENLAVKKEKEKLQKEKLEAEEAVKSFEEKLKSSTELNVEKPKACLSIEEYETQLAKLKDRLLENEKNLRKIKKDFIPLRKVNNTLESDEKKLRRREALVAKQKVELYGVNNMVDIDQEKAKKLTEDLDLLEGLKLSVKHCQEVMEANKDRYPILEKTYNILFNDNKTLKEDIEELEEKIANLKIE